MLVTFRSTATESVTMFHDVAVDLLKLMGATGKIPGALNPEDVPAALQKLEASIERLRLSNPHAETAAPPADNEDWSEADERGEDDKDKAPPVDITVRAVPLISMLKRAAGAHAELVWEGK